MWYEELNDENGKSLNHSKQKAWLTVQDYDFVLFQVGTLLIYILDVNSDFLLIIYMKDTKLQLIKGAGLSEGPHSEALRDYS